MLVIGASTFNSVNGMRLIFTHSGQGLGKPRRPDNPYEPASINNRQRSGLCIAFVLTAVAMLYEANVLFSGE
jgi:succinate dehydrogenase / fumarate reductase, cytochrome b subunit